MNIETEQVQNTTIVSPHGDIDTQQSTRLREELKSILNSTTQQIIVDLSGVKYIDSSGIATLIEALQICKQGDKQFALCGLNSGVRSVIELARLDTIFVIEETREDALLD
jgi:anti-sigma B factor antagonist